MTFLGICFLFLVMWVIGAVLFGGSVVAFSGDTPFGWEGVIMSLAFTGLLLGVWFIIFVVKWWNEGGAWY